MRVDRGQCGLVGLDYSTVRPRRRGDTRRRVGKFGCRAPRVDRCRRHGGERDASCCVPWPNTGSNTDTGSNTGTRTNTDTHAYTDSAAASRAGSGPAD